MAKTKHVVPALLLTLCLLSTPGHAQEVTPTPYFVTYDHHMEELNALEINNESIIGRDPSINTEPLPPAEPFREPSLQQTRTMTRQRNGGSVSCQPPH